MGTQSGLTNVTIYTDASHCQETKVAGVAYWARDDSNRWDGATSFTDVPQSSDAEVMALVWAVQKVRRARAFKDARLILTSDCLTALEFLSGIRQHTLSARSLAARGVFRDLTKDVAVKFNHVKGHSKHDGARSYINSLVDKRARAVMRAARGNWKLPLVGAVHSEQLNPGQNAQTGE